MGRKVGLSAADVVGAASVMADRDGLEATTLAKLAAQLGVRSPSLYAHVDGVAGLRRRLALRAAALMQALLADAVDGLDGAAALRAATYAFRGFIREHPGLYAATLPAPRPGEDDELYDAMAAASGPVIDAAQRAGLHGANAIHMARALRATAHGFATLEAAGGFGQPVDVEASFALTVSALIDGAIARPR